MKALTFLKTTTVLNILIATGFSVAGMLKPGLLLTPGNPTEKAISIFALYAAARTIPLAAFAIITALGKYRDTLISLALLAGVVQFLDVFIGIYQQDVSKTAGPFFIAVLQFVAVYLVVKKGAVGIKG